jgi:hypothetical protein
MIQSGDPVAAHAVLSTLAIAEPALTPAVLDSSALIAVAEVSGGTVTKAHRLARKAVFMRPWEIRNWRALAYTHSAAVSRETESS